MVSGPNSYIFSIFDALQFKMLVLKEKYCSFRTSKIWDRTNKTVLQST